MFRRSLLLASLACLGFAGSVYGAAYIRDAHMEHPVILSRCGPLCWAMRSLKLAELAEALRAAPFEAIEKADRNHGWLAAAMGVNTESLASLDSVVTTTPNGRIRCSPADPASYEFVFKHRPTQRELEVVGDASNEMDKSIKTSPTDTPRGISDFQRMLLRSKSALFTIIGHNESGYLIIPPSGKISLSEMSDTCAKYKKFCVFISCNSRTYVNGLGVDGRISFRKAVELNNGIRDLAENAVENRRSQMDLSVRPECLRVI